MHPLIDISTLGSDIVHDLLEGIARRAPKPPPKIFVA
jgi:hypothetical protein